MTSSEPSSQQQQRQSKAQAETMHGLAGLVLAAGASTRMGASTNKLVEEVEGRPLVAWAVDAMIEAGLDRVIVVVGFEAARVREALRGRACHFVSSPDWRAGMGSSLAAGVQGAGLDDALRGLFVSVGDLPGLRSDVFLRMGEALAAEATARERILVPMVGGKPGHPVLFGSAYFSALSELEGDQGGRPVIEAHAERVTRLVFEDESLRTDLDSPADFVRFREGRALPDSSGKDAPKGSV